MKRIRAIASTLVFAIAGTAQAGPASDAAKSHFAAIASGDIADVMRDYADDARLNWIGGLFDGSHNGPAAIRTTWEKFKEVHGDMRFSLGQLEESANSKGATVVASVLFAGKTSVKVRFVLTYRDGKLVSETWQIDSTLKIPT
jgi:ketosteroid isomerase-like protein